MESCQRCSAQCLHKLCMHKVPVFSALDNEELAKIAAIIGHSEYQKGEILFAEGGRPDSLFILNEGSVKAYKYTPDGREQILYVFSEGDFFGEQHLFSAKPAAYFTEALEPVKCCTLSKSDLQQILRSYPEIALKIIEELETRLSRLENALQSIGVRSVDARVSGLILEFGEKYGTPVPEGILIRLPLSREGMANYLGIARETVSRKLGQLESEGVLRSVSGKSLLILDMESLKTAAGKYE